MRRTSPVLLIVIGILVIFLFWGCSQYNGIVTAENKVDKAWSDVNAQYQRKKNLYDNVVASIKGSARNEDTTLIKITQMRSRIPNSLDANNPQALNQANQQLDQMKGTILNINFENYPNLQTTQQFREFQNQIDRTEGRVANAIRDWSSTVQEYNQKVITFPGSIFASMFGKHKNPISKLTKGQKTLKLILGDKLIMKFFPWHKKKDFFSVEEKKQLVEAIQNAELNTSGEVRVFIESKCKFVNAIDRAQEVFYTMGMEKTELRNATLIYVAVKDKQAAVFGDAGIHQKVGAQYWTDVVNEMLLLFKKDKLADGICQAINLLGNALKTYFPYNKEIDKNELPDEVVFGK